MIGLTRKSRGDDEGTHEDQERIILARAQSEGFEVVRMEREHRVSGAKDWRKREIGRAIADVKSGRADGIVVAYQDRITRERLLAGAEIWEAMEAAGAVFVACDGVDSRQEGSELMFAIKAAVAREQWRIYKKRSDDGRGRSVTDRHIHGGSRTPVGYLRDDDRRLVVDPATAPHVLECFRMRVRGESWVALSRYLEANGVRTSVGGRNGGGSKWADTGLSAMIRNRVYLGEARSGGFVQEGAHEAIVDETMFRAANLQRTERPVSLAGREPALLAGVLYCSGCSRRLTRDYRSGNKAHPIYRCKGNPGCDRRVTVSAAKIEPFVEALILELLLDEQTERGVEHELDAAVRVAQNDLAAVEAIRGSVRPAAYAQALSDAQEALERAQEARAAVVVELAQDEHAAELEARFLSGDEGVVLAMWNRTPVADRRVVIRSLLATGGLRGFRVLPAAPGPVSARLEPVRAA